MFLLEGTVLSRPFSEGSLPEIKQTGSRKSCFPWWKCRKFTVMPNLLTLEVFEIQKERKGARKIRDSLFNVLN